MDLRLTNCCEGRFDARLVWEADISLYLGQLKKWISRWGIPLLCHLFVPPVQGCDPAHRLPVPVPMIHLLSLSMTAAQDMAWALIDSPAFLFSQ